MYSLNRNASSIPGPYYKIGPFSIPTVSITLFSIVFVTLGSHFEALKSVLLIFVLVYASKTYDQTDSCAPKRLPRITKTVMQCELICSPTYHNDSRICYERPQGVRGASVYLYLYIYHILFQPRE
jgi:hypothetical protein